MVATTASDLTDTQPTGSSSQATAATAPSPLSLFSHLRAPMQSVITRKWKVRINEAKQQLAQKQSREHDIAQAFQLYEQKVHHSGESLSEAHQLWRLQVDTATIPRAGVPLTKIDHLLEENTYSLTDQRGMCTLIPFVLSGEQQRIKAELQGERPPSLLTALPG